MTPKKIGLCCNGKLTNQRQRQRGTEKKERQRELGKVSIYLWSGLNSPAGFSTLSPGSLCNDCDFRKQLWLSISFSTVFGKETAQSSFISRQCCNHMPVCSSQTRWLQCVTTLGSIRWRLYAAAAGDSSATGRVSHRQNMTPLLWNPWLPMCLPLGIQGVYFSL